MKRGSALIMAIWIIAILSVMVLSFATEAHMQTGINVYVRERNRVNRLIDAGKILGEVVMLGYEEAKEWSEDENVEDMLEDDRWYREKRALKFDSKCKIGPILLDEEDVDSGTVTVEIELANGGESNGINVNELYAGSDKNYLLRWQMILMRAGIDEELEVEDEEGHKVNMINMLVASWCDWRDEDDSVTAIEGDEVGAESKWYQERDEENKTEEEDRKRPRNGAIENINELSFVKGFRQYPAVLTGGLLYPKEKESEDNPKLNGIIGLFGTSGSSKINVNNCTVEQLLTIPGIFNEEDVDDQEDSMELAKCIVDTLKVKPEDYDVDETRDWWPYKDWSDLCSRVEDNMTSSSVKIGEEAQQYLSFLPDKNSVFKMKITGESLGMKHTVSCECYLNTKDKKVRYIKWRED